MIYAYEKWQIKAGDTFLITSSQRRFEKVIVTKINVRDKPDYIEVVIPRIVKTKEINIGRLLRRTTNGTDRLTEYFKDKPKKRRFRTRTLFHLNGQTAKQADQSVKGGRASTPLPKAKLDELVRKFMQK